MTVAGLTVMVSRVRGALRGTGQPRRGSSMATTASTDGSCWCWLMAVLAAANKPGWMSR